MASNSFCNRALVVTALLAVASIGGLGPQASAQGTITNGIVSLSWSPNPSHGLVFTSIGEPTQPQTFTFRAANLWQLEFRNPTGPTVTTLGASDLSGFSVAINQLSGSSLSVTWSQCTSPLLPPGVTFSVTVTADAPAGEKVVVLGIGVQATTASAVSLYAVSFPRVEFDERGTSPANQVLSYPFAGGWMFPDPMHNATIPADAAPEQALVHPGSLSMQWFGYYDRSEADPRQLFLGTRDSCGWRKEYFLHRINSPTGPEAMRFRVRVMPENNLALAPTTTFTGVPAVLGMLHGTWFDAARLYRSWAVLQPWTTRGPVRTNQDFSSLIKNAKMFGSVAPDACTSTPQGSQCGAPADPTTYQWWDDDVADKKAYFGVDSIPTHPYLWDDSAFDAYLGNWLPAKAPFLATIPFIQALGDPFAPYFLNNVYSANANGAQNSLNLPGTGGAPVSTFAVTLENGLPYTITDQRCLSNVGCSTPTQSVSIASYKLDLATCFASEYTLSMATTLTGMGARGMYLDTYSVDDVAVSYNSVEKVSPAVSKPVGGGCSQGAAKIQLVDNLRRTMRTTGGVPDFYTISEGQQEMFVGSFELVYGNYVGAAVDVNGQPRTRMAPLFDTVYRDYQFTSTVGPMDYHAAQVLPQFAPFILIARQNYAGYLFSGRLPHAGSVLNQATLAQDAAQAPAFNQYVGMIQNYMGILRQTDARAYVVFGERMRDPVTTVKTANLPGAAVTGADGAWYVGYDTQPPLTFTSVFKRPDLNAFAVMFLNWTDVGDVIPNLAPGATPGSQTFQYTVNPADYGLPTGQYKRSEVVASGLPAITFLNLNGPTTFNITVPARSARVIVFRKT